MASNGISTLTYKRDRQIAKLDAAATKRGETYTLTQLPTSYGVNSNAAADIINHGNVGGLIQGRPWSNEVASVDTSSIGLSTGAYERTFSSYFGDTGGTNTVAADQTAYDTWLSGATQTNGDDVTSISRSGTVGTTTTYTINAYFLAPGDGEFTFYINSDDASYLWISEDAEDVTDLSSATVQNNGLHAARERSGTVNLVSGRYYKLFAIFGNNTGPGTAVFSYESTDAGISKTTNFSGQLFYDQKFVEFDPSIALSGSTVINQSDYLFNNGTMVNATRVSGSPDYFNFDGTGDYIRSPELYQDLGGPNDSFSLSAWIYPTAEGVVASTTDTTTPSTAYHFSTMEIIEVSGNPTPYFGVWNGGIQSDSGSAISYNTWYHMSITYNGSVMKGYINGSEVASVTTAYDSPLDSTSTNWYILWGADDSTNMGDGTAFNGRMGHLKIFNDALSPTEVAAQYNINKADYGY